MKTNMLPIIRGGRLISLGVAVIAMPFSVPWCHAGLWAALLFILMEGLWKQNAIAIITHPIVILFGCFILLHATGLIYTEDVGNGWSNINKKVALLLVPLGLAAGSRLQPRQRDTLFRLFIASCFAATAICLAHAALVSSSGKLSSGGDVASFMNATFWKLNEAIPHRWIYFSYEELASGIRIHPTYFSLYLLFCILLMNRFLDDQGHTFSGAQKAVLLSLSVYFGIFIIFLASKIVTLAFLSFVVVAVLQRMKNYGQAARLAMVMLVLGFFALMIRINPVSWYRDYQEMRLYPIELPPAPQNSMSTSIRASLWWLGIQSIADINPVWGGGTGDVSRVMAATARKYGISNSLGSNDPHNQFINTLLGLGFVGLIALGACFGFPAYWAFLSRNYFYLSFLGAFVLVCLTESVFEFQKGIVFFSLFNSILIFHDSKWPSSLLISPPHA